MISSLMSQRSAKIETSRIRLSGSTVAPYVLMGLLYQGKGPTAIVNRDVCTLTLPGCSLLNVPYGHGFEHDPCMLVNDGDSIRFERKGDSVSITVLERA